MKIPLYHIDAFTTHLFAGNPAAVCVLPEWIADNLLFQIAKENNLPATAFLVRDKQRFLTRWVSPEYEIPLCGHGSLASGYVIFNFLEPTWQKVDLQSPLEHLRILRNGDWISLDFPVKKIEHLDMQPLLAQGLGCVPKEVYQHKNERCLVVFEKEDEVRQLKPDLNVLKALDYLGITVTAKAAKVDFVSRTFYPKKTISEDPATGSSHCLLAPYWAERLHKTELHAQQVSVRGGEMMCKLQGDRVLITGKAVEYMRGEIFL